MNRAKRRDANESEIVKALRAAGASVTLLDGDGVPDLLVGKGGKTWLIEVKNPAAKGGGKYNTGEGALTRDQVAWRNGWRGEAAAVVYSIQEALAAIGVGS